MAPTDRQDLSLWPALCKGTFRQSRKNSYTVRQRVRIVKDIDEGCAWCGAQETIYHFVKSCPMVRLMYAACRDVVTPVVQGVDVGRWVADNPLISLTHPTGLCVW